MPLVIDGKSFAARLRETIAAEASQMHHDYHVTPGLAVILVGDDPASEVYVRNKAKQTMEAGMQSYDFRYPSTLKQDELLEKIRELNADKEVHGILVQLPLPKHIDERAVIEAIDPLKDVDGFHPYNIGRLVAGEETLVPCTPLGCMMLLKDTLGDDLSGKHAIVIGRSNIVGKPMSILLLQANCTVTIAHSRTKNLVEEIGRADIVVAAVGKPEMIKGEWIKPGSVVIDVGINRITNPDGSTRLVGDVEFEAAQARASAITPVPGGVGPMTIACLLHNTLRAARLQHGIPL